MGESEIAIKRCVIAAKKCQKLSVIALNEYVAQKKFTAMLILIVKRWL